MLSYLKDGLKQSPSGIRIGIAFTNGGGGEALLVAVDEIGVVVTFGDDVNCYPWTAIARIRLI